jgi:hypothetical protein
MGRWCGPSRDQRLLFINGTANGFGVALLLILQPLSITSLGAAPEQSGATVL